MSPMVLAAALLAAPVPDGPVSAGEVYDECAAFAATPGDAGVDLELKSRCELHATVQVAVAEIEAAADAAAGKTRPRSCPPESADSRPLLRAFLDYVRRNPASRGLNAYDVFDQALAETWPCPR